MEHSRKNMKKSTYLITASFPLKKDIELLGMFAGDEDAKAAAIKWGNQFLTETWQPTAMTSTVHLYRLNPANPVYIVYVGTIATDRSGLGNCRWTKCIPLKNKEYWITTHPSVLDADVRTVGYFSNDASAKRVASRIGDALYAVSLRVPCLCINLLTTEKLEGEFKVVEIAHKIFTKDGGSRWKSSAGQYNKNY